MNDQTMNPIISQSGVNLLCLKNFAANREVIGTEIITEIAMNPMRPNLCLIYTILRLPFVKTGLIFFDFQ